MSPSTGDPATHAERQCLVISALGNLLIGAVGLIFAAITLSQAILLDGFFNLIYFGTALFAIKVAGLVQRGDDERFPAGYAFFEPLVNGLKGVLVLGVTVMAVAGAVEALLAGGRNIAAGAAIGYGLFAAVVCWSLALATRRGAKRSGSPLVRADAENWLVNGAISSAVLLAFVGIPLIKGTSLAFVAPYVDPSLVLVVALISISVPVRMAWQALMELLNRAPAPVIVQEVRQIIETCTADLEAKELFVRVLQPGRVRMVMAHVVLPGDAEPRRLESLDALRETTLRRLQEAHLATFLDMVFTTDRKWGAPVSLDPEA
jgi:cation diffusion facilitator family transporter